MPVKIRCRGCEKTLSAPDKAAGRVIQCPKCGTKLKVPGAKLEPKGARKKAKQPSMMDSSEFIAGLDLSNVESRDERICPYCAAEMPGEDPVCRRCGMNTETGAMDAREAKKRARRGPDPAQFYSKAWGDSWDFVKRHRSLALRTGWYMSVLAVMCSGCAFMVGFCKTGPPIFFWFMLTSLTAMGIAGWFWYLTYKVIEVTMTRNEKILERIDFDMFAVISLGLRLLFWPFVVCMGPFAILTPFLPLFYPLATVHLTQKYTYKAWVGWEMAKVLVRNFAPAAYFCVVGLVVFLPVALVAVPIFWWMGHGNPFVAGNIHAYRASIVDWFLRLTGNHQPDPETFVFILCMIPLKIIAAFLVLTPIFLAAAIPSVFMMRVNGLLGHYNRETLDLVNFIPPNTPATFWVRVLAFSIDSVLCWFASFLVVKERRTVIIGWFINAIMFLLWWYVPFGFLLAIPFWWMYMFWMYFAISESTTTRTTIGKDAFGLIVNDMNNKQMTLKKATVRVLGRFVCMLTFNLGYLLAAMPQKRGLHDMIAGTKCCWRGDR